MRHLPSLNALRTFEAAARLTSISNAGQELCVSHGAVSRQVKLLEHWLGVKLFERDGRSLQLTSAGAAYLKTCSAALDLIEEGTVNLQQQRSSNVIGVATTHSFAERWLMARLPSFRAEHPNIEVWIVLEQQLTQFAQPGIDVAIRMGTGPWPQYHSRPLMQDRLIPVCSPNLIETGPEITTPEDLLHYPLLHDQDPKAQWAVWLKANNIKGIDLNRGPRYSSSNIVLQAALSGQGIALANEALVKDDIERGHLIQVLSLDVNLGTNYWIVTPNQNSKLKKVIAFSNWLEKTAQV